MKILRNKFLAICLMTSTALTITLVEYTHSTESTSSQHQSVQLSQEEISRRADIFLDALERDNPGVAIDRERLKKTIENGRLIISTRGIKNLPSEIGNITNIKILDLKGNQLTSLPPEIGNLTNLEVLSLVGNQLTRLPPEIGNLTNLRSLNFMRNLLTSLLPEIGNLTTLEGLNLVGNQLTGLPPEIGKLINLRMVYLSGNQLTSLPPEIGNLVRLGHLGLTSNQLMELPSEVKNLHNLAVFELAENPLLPRGESEQTWGRAELRQHFRDRVIFGDEIGQPMPGDTTLDQVTASLDKNPLRINREMLKSIRIPDIPGETFENGEEFMELFSYLISHLNFSHEDKPGYLSYELLAGDYASEARNDQNASNTDKIFKYLLPRLTGYFKALYNLPVDDGESQGWQMYDENKPSLKKALSFILRSINELEDPEQRALLFIIFVDGMLHCPTGQKEGIDTVVLSLLGGKTTSSDWRVVLSNHLALKKNLHFKTAILAKGANSGQNVHLISTYEGRLRELLGLSDILGYTEKMGIFGEDPFNGNPYNVYQVYFQLLPVPRLVDWAMEKIQTASDRELQAQLAELVTQEQQAKQGGSMSAAIPALVRRLESLKLQMTNPDVPEENKPAIAAQIGQVETMIRRSGSGASGESSQLSSEEKKEFSRKIMELRGKARAAQEFHPITNEMIIGYLKEEMGGHLQEGWWQGYFSADPVINPVAALTHKGTLKLLIKLGYIIDERNKG